MGRSGATWRTPKGRSAQPATRAHNRERLVAIRDEVLRRVPGTAVAADQPYREFDLAIDYAEDVSPLSLDAARAVAAIFEQHGATARISSIHVNGWFGAFDKLSMTQRFAREIDRIDLDAARARYAFIGDSANDEPLFAYFPCTFGVSNVRRFLPLMQAAPAVITQAETGDGFVEAVEALLASNLRKPRPA